MRGVILYFNFPLLHIKVDQNASGWQCLYLAIKKDIYFVLAYNTIVKSFLLSGWVLHCVSVALCVYHNIET